MFVLHSLRSIEHPALQPYRTLKMQTDHYREKIFVAEGEKVVRRLLESHLEVISACLPQKWLAEFEPLLAARAETIVTFILEKEELEKITGFSMYQGVMAVGRVPEAVELASILNNARRPWLFCALDGLNNSENVGIVVRNAAAFGVDALVVGETSSSPFMRRAVRSSMGTIFSLPVVHSPDLPSTLRHLQEQGVTCLAAHPHGDEKELFESDFRSDCCIVLGSEGFGLSPSVLAACDASVMIPMTNGVDSLNVGSAAAVFFSEALRQRKLLNRQRGS